MTLLRHGGSVAGLAASLIILTGCNWFGETEAPPLPGDRVSVLFHDSDLQPDPQLAGQPVVLGRAVSGVWSQAGGGPLHAVGHAAGPSKIERATWNVDIGAGASSRRPLLSGPAGSAT